MIFREVVAATPDVATGFRNGLTALGKYKGKVVVSNTRLLQGSVDIDECTAQKYPTDNRWDYVFAYNGKTFFIEVHSANTREVKTVINKLQWLKNWLNQSAPAINKLKATTPYYWIQSGGFAIPKTSPQYREASRVGLKPIAQLNLP
ncbi:hypothetical protein FACS1894156_7110 [Bacteroidia bacterium]|nr:hypothetical protein FACS1894156_7110 [Bacteroidia bacterium]